ncbi:MAG: DUF1232 domain-containing protein [Nitrospirae bacterium]|nr:DUF1232 domain-containing protein [Nitrospirota bacterium]
MLEQLKQTSALLRTELKAYQHAIAHAGTPKAAKVLLGLAVGYTLLPFDIIPDFIPVIGHIDDAIIVPFLVIAALGMIPPEVMQECRERARNALQDNT